MTIVQISCLTDRTAINCLSHSIIITSSCARNRSFLPHSCATGSSESYREERDAFPARPQAATTCRPAPRTRIHCLRTYEGDSPHDASPFRSAKTRNTVNIVCFGVPGYGRFVGPPMIDTCGNPPCHPKHRFRQDVHSNNEGFSRRLTKLL